MSEGPTCPNCGNELPAGSPRKLCPRCLLRAGLGSGAESVPRNGGHSATAGLTAPVGHVLDSIAASIGSVPRVSSARYRRRSRAPALSSGRRRRCRVQHPLSHRRRDRPRRHGGGAQGRDPDIGRDVALKVLREDFRDNADMVRRFVEEAQIGGQLQHPGIVPIYELGTFSDRRPFFSMKLVKGHTLAELAGGSGELIRRAAQVPGDLRVDRPDRCVRPCAWRHPSRPETVERDGGLVRRGPGDGLGPGEGFAARWGCG